ncbi:MAG: hypothetical protein M3477_06140 [Gemmatimonadota bacterium]|nr:hypothetical protein [Gemmatimonadota bacterium]
MIAADRDPRATAAWLARHLGTDPVGDRTQPAPARAETAEFRMPEPQDLPHDVAVEASGTVLVTGMFTHRLYRAARPGQRPLVLPLQYARPR